MFLLHSLGSGGWTSRNCDFVDPGYVWSVFPQRLGLISGEPQVQWFHFPNYHLVVMCHLTLYLLQASVLCNFHFYILYEV